jgi:protein-S-isoprenylcysteine O-methyltransferase Ste14
MVVNTAYILVYVAFLIVGRFLSQSQRKADRLWLQTQRIANDPTAILMAFSAFVGFGAPLLEAAWRTRVTPLGLTLSGILVMTVGFLTAYSANRTIARNWSPVIAKTKEQRLIQSGIYSTIRHPLYFSGLLLLIGTNLYFGNSWSWLSTLLATIITLYRIPIEEKQLEGRFGQEYADYKSRTKALIPWVH